MLHPQERPTGLQAARCSERIRTSSDDRIGPHLLFDPLDPELQKQDADARKFRVPRSLRDVESPVNLWVKTLEGVALDAATEGRGMTAVQSVILLYQIT